MHKANLSRSPRLQRLLAALQDGRAHSTMELIREAGICAVNSAVAELRLNGYRVSCHVGRNTEQGRRGRVWRYQLMPTIGTLVELDAPPDRPACTMIYA